MKTLKSIALGAVVITVMIGAWAIFAVSYLIAPRAIERLYVGR